MAMAPDSQSPITGPYRSVRARGVTEAALQFIQTFSAETIELYPDLGGPVETTNGFRRYPRFNSPKPTFSAWQSASQKYVSRVESLGLGGFFIRTPEPAPLGTLIQLLLDTSEGDIRARAQVKNCSPKH